MHGDVFPAALGYGTGDTHNAGKNVNGLKMWVFCLSYGRSHLAVLLAPLELARSGEDGIRSKYMTIIVVKDTNAVIHFFTQ